MCGRSRTVLGGRQAVRNNSLYPWLAVSIARSVPHGWYTPFISQGNAAVGRQEQTREHASICTLMKVLSITNRPAGQASGAQQLSLYLSLSRCIDRSVYIPLHFSRRSQTRASSLCCLKCNQHISQCVSPESRCQRRRAYRKGGVQGEGVNPGAAFREHHEKRGNGKMSNHASTPRRHAQ